MKSTISFIMLVVFLFSSSFATATDANLGIKGQREFKLSRKVGEPELKFVSDAPLEDIKGKVKSDAVSGNMALDPSNIEATAGLISFKVTGMETGISTRDKHLQSKEWLNAPANPNITFQLTKLTSVKVNSSNQGKSEIEAMAEGTFSMNGKSKELKLPIKITIVKESEATQKRGGGDLAFVDGKFDIALKDFNVKGAKGIVGSKVGEVINVSFQLFFSTK